MIDTIAINLKSFEFAMQPSYYNSFTPSVENFFIAPFAKLGGRGVIKAECNPTSRDKQSGLYFPRLTMFRAVRKEGIGVFLRVEFSIPKLLYGNNFDEVTEDDFELVCKILVERLKHFGILTSEKIVAQADVSAIHYSKNIVLTDYTTASEIIRELNKSDISLLRDINSSDFRNSGHSFKVHTNHFEFIAYDKKEDLKKAKTSEKRSVEKSNQCQISLFEENTFKKPFEVLRLEARYGNKTELKKLFTSLKLETPSITFKSLFSERFSKLALQNELAKIKACHPSVMDYKFRTPNALYSDLVVCNPKAKLADILSAVGLRTLLDEVGSREIKKFSGRKSYEWYRFKKKMQTLAYTPRQRGCFERLETALDKFVPIKLATFKLTQKNL